VRVSTRACRPQLRALRVDVDDYIYECDTREKKEVAVHSLLRGPEAGALVVSDSWFLIATTVSQLVERNAVSYAGRALLKSTWPLMSDDTDYEY
jgi:hypothetical protein